MKFLVIVGFIFAILKIDARPTANATFLQETSQQASSCNIELGDHQEVRVLEGILPEDNDAFNVYWGCIWKKKGIVNDDAEIDPTNLRRYLEGIFSLGDQDTEANTLLARTMVRECENMQGKDYGQKAVKIQNCVLQQLYKLVEQNYD